MSAICFTEQLKDCRTSAPCWEGKRAGSQLYQGGVECLFDVNEEHRCVGTFARR